MLSDKIFDRIGGLTSKNLNAFDPSYSNTERLFRTVLGTSLS